MGPQLDRFLEELCWRKEYLTYVFIIAATFTVLQIPYLLVTEFESELYVIATINVAGFATFALASGGLIRYCNRRRRREMDDAR